ncbi:MAG TPA: protein translocase subunit SecD [Candidatus Angelobacter sp.]|nr:protein translocase subunit SecD [Candidatus Angelobacter sp.]
MQKNLLLKALLIVAVLMIFVYGIFGIPKSLKLDGLKQSLLERINLGLDLKGGIHLILQVQVNDAVNAESERAAETLKEELQKANVPFTEITPPDPVNHPDQVVIKGLSPDGSSQLRKIVTDQLQTYDVTVGPDKTYIVAMKPSAANDVKNRTVEQSIEAIRRRVDTLGVSEPVIEEHGVGNYQILVQLPGVDDPTRVKDIIQSTARLELREALDQGRAYASEDEARNAHSNILPPNTILLHGQKSVNDRGDAVFIVSRVPVVSGTDIKGAEAGHKSDSGAPIVNFYLTTSAGEKFGRFTAIHQKNGSSPSNLAIVLDDRVIEAPGIESEIHDQGLIEGGFTEQSANDLAMLLRSGALPASIHYIQESTVGPSLGADSIRKGVEAAIVGMVAVMIFMLVYYHGAGINADLALFLNLVILLGFMGFSGATLTLPGIAGVILTVGMGVDSNVLIFERIREELRHGKAPSAAVDQGFARAWVTIIDTHVTTIVSAFILFIFGTGPVKGFAVTLTFGLLANLFTAVFVSRVIFDAILSRKQRGEALSI